MSVVGQISCFNLRLSGTLTVLANLTDAIQGGS